MFLDRMNRIIWIILLYLKFPEEIPNEQSATPKSKTFAKRPEGALMVSYAIKPLITAQSSRDVVTF
jgi:hypothetical protein